MKQNKTRQNMYSYKYDNNLITYFRLGYYGKID